MRRRRCLIAAAGLAALAGGAGGAGAQEADSATSAVSIYAEARVVSRYVWRGYDLSRGKPALQPWVEGALPNGLGFNAFVTSALDRRTEVDEAQLGLTYTRELRPGWEVGAGYLSYLQFGTETEPNFDDPDTLSFNRAGEFLGNLTWNWEHGYATLTYSRGHASGEGNSVNLWVQREFEWADGRWTAEPYLQADYLDEYGPPSRLDERVSGVEIGVPVSRRLGSLRLQLAGYVTWVPSAYVRSSNRDIGASGDGLLWWAAFAVVHERD